MAHPEIFVHLVDFHNLKGNELVAENEDGSYTILINARLTAEKQQEAYLHAMQHINNNDFEKDDVQSIEYFAHKIIA